MKIKPNDIYFDSKYDKKFLVLFVSEKNNRIAYLVENYDGIICDSIDYFLERFTKAVSTEDQINSIWNNMIKKYSNE